MLGVGQETNNLQTCNLKETRNQLDISIQSAGEFRFKSIQTLVAESTKAKEEISKEASSKVLLFILRMKNILRLEKNFIKTTQNICVKQQKIDIFLPYFFLLTLFKVTTYLCIRNAIECCQIFNLLCISTLTTNNGNA